MRRLQRPGYVVPTLADDGIAGKKRLEHSKNYNLHKVIPKKIDSYSYWTKLDVRGLLYAMQGRVCAYCGVETNGLDVEHFRPKGKIEGDEDHGGYWWLAYICSNYFLGCTVCNQKRKRNRFPLENGAVRITYDTRTQIKQEQRILLDPEEDPVEEWLELEWNDLTCRLLPHSTLSDAQYQRVQTVIDFFGLNLEPELRKQRSQVYEQAVRAAGERDWDQLRRMAMCHREHSFVARFVLSQVAPEQLSDPREEWQDRVIFLWNDLTTQVQEILALKGRGKVPSPQDELHVESLCWALVVLQTEAPVGEMAALPDFLERLLLQEPAHIRAEVLTAFGKLQRPKNLRFS
jgi:uncharacterized protein (TIGR02646 family)